MISKQLEKVIEIHYMVENGHIPVYSLYSKGILDSIHFTRTEAQIRAEKIMKDQNLHVVRLKMIKSTLSLVSYRAI